jgi:putative tricarboxylic transport membrane protein
LSIPEAPRSLTGPRIAAVVLAGLGALAIVQGLSVESGGYTAVGPGVFPVIVGTGLVVFGSLFLMRTTLRPDEHIARRAGAEEAATNWRSTGAIVAALSVYAFALDLLGYVVATVLFFCAVARVLGSRRLVRDVVLSGAMSALLYYAFTQVLGVRLP